MLTTRYTVAAYGTFTIRMATKGFKSQVLFMYVNDSRNYYMNIDRYLWGSEGREPWEGYGLVVGHFFTGRNYGHKDPMHLHDFYWMMNRISFFGIITPPGDHY